MREALIDAWALAQSRVGGDDVLRLQTRSAVWEQVLIGGALGADFVAGAASFFGFAIISLSALLLSALFLIVLSFTQTQRRRRLFDALRLRRRNGGIAK